MYKRPQSVLCDNPTLALSIPVLPGCPGQSRLEKKKKKKRALRYILFIPSYKERIWEEKNLSFSSQIPGWKLCHLTLPIIHRYDSCLIARGMWLGQYDTMKWCMRVTEYLREFRQAFVCSRFSTFSGVAQGLSSVLTLRSAFSSFIAGLSEKHGQPSLELIFINEE